MFNEIAALLTVVDTNVPSVDATTQASYLPLVGNDVTLVGLPFGLSVEYSPQRLKLANPIKTGTARLGCWVKHGRSNLATDLQLVSNLGSEIIDAIVENDGDGYRLQIPYSVVAAVNDTPVEIGNVVYFLIEVDVAIQEID